MHTHKLHLFKAMIALLLLVALGLSVTSCNRKYANAGDKKKAYKRKYKCKMCYNSTEAYLLTYYNQPTANPSNVEPKQ